MPCLGLHHTAGCRFIRDQKTGVAGRWPSAMQTPLRWHPIAHADSAKGKSGSLVRPTRLRHSRGSQAPPRDWCDTWDDEGFGDLIADGLDRVEAGHRLLKIQWPNGAARYTFGPQAGALSLRPFRLNCPAPVPPVGSKPHP